MLRLLLEAFALAKPSVDLIPKMVVNLDTHAQATESASQ